MITELLLSLTTLVLFIWCLLILIGYKRVIWKTSTMMIKLNEGYNSAIAAGALFLVYLVWGWGYTQILICVFFMLALWLIAMRFWSKVNGFTFLGRLAFIVLLVMKFFFIATPLAYDSEERKNDLEQALLQID